jgi:putative ABC transport system permease protein
LVLAAVGLYGVLAYRVALRTREIGVRMALGARAPDVFTMILRQSLALTFTGIGIGLLLSLAVSRGLASVLSGVSATDTLTYGSVSLLWLGVAALAGYLPARRAAKVDPMVALRYE